MNKNKNNNYLVSKVTCYSGIIKEEPILHLNGIVFNKFYSIYLRVYFFKKNLYYIRINIGIEESFNLEFSINKNNKILLRLIDDTFINPEAIGIASTLMLIHEEMIINWLKSINSIMNEKNENYKLKILEDIFTEDIFSEENNKLSFVQDLCENKK
jgi:hypothetical protein